MRRKQRVRIARPRAAPAHRHDAARHQLHRDAAARIQRLGDATEEIRRQGGPAGPWGHHRAAELRARRQQRVQGGLSRQHIDGSGISGT